MSHVNSRSRINHLSYNANAPKKAIYRIQSQSDQERSQFIISTFINLFKGDIDDNPSAFRSRFRKMAATPFNFYRGSAILFYQDLKIDNDPFIVKNNAAGQIFIHGDLHSENFGTYLDNNGILNFDCNDFDESYVGPFTWDVKRLCASINLICYSKGFSDRDIQKVLAACIEEYVKQVYKFCNQSKENSALTLRTTTGKINKLLNETRIKSHVEHLNKMTCIENYDRKFIRSTNIVNVDNILHEHLIKAFQQYLESVPDYKKYSDRPINGKELTYKIKDIVQCLSAGIGSAGKVSYLFLIEGRTETLENDIIICMKPAQKSALSYAVRNERFEQYFGHDGLRIVLCSYAMQASTPKWLGYTTLNSTPCIVDAITAHAENLNWSDINDFDDVIEVVQHLGRATAKIHCIADSDCANTPKDISCLPFSIIPQDTEHVIRDAIDKRDDEFIQDMIEFGMVYGELVRRDHHLFFEALRNKQIPGI